MVIFLPIDIILLLLLLLSYFNFLFHSYLKKNFQFHSLTDLYPFIFLYIHRSLKILLRSYYGISSRLNQFNSFPKK